ncbi:hypothetical protein F511_27512 [Dorcoceras hygrometricum]|uniref:Uncharacterized protein n=1 Tax=Dorcoceras hygrometricum TaxID=472368 RepID=A0A2Z7BBV2_9LAMI|nr:hypothetical protein F511_27512 [Dorcoceras hygrometricum]
MSLSVRISGWKDIRRCVEDVCFVYRVLDQPCRVEMSGSAVGSVVSDRIQMSAVLVVRCRVEMSGSAVGSVGSDRIQMSGFPGYSAGRGVGPTGGAPGGG